MCGIAGILDWSGNPQATSMDAMVATQIHRGPDHQQVIARQKVIFGHSRLAIIDLDQASNQPMSLEDEGLCIVYNGEIYNFEDLRRELEALGRRFRTKGDTEVILHAYAQWGLCALNKLNGMFAFALWDEKKERLILARDRAGKKPLYYQRLAAGNLIFASELKALRQHPSASAEINPRAMGHFLRLSHTLSDTCILKGIQKLPAAHYAVFTANNEPEIIEYWNLAQHYCDKRHPRNEDEASEELRALIDDAVRIRMISDVPLGAFLSGGIDSATIVAAMARLNTPMNTKTFSIGFQEPTYSELSEAKGTAGKFGVDHHEKLVMAEMADILPETVRFADEPFADNSILPFYFLSQHARENVTVCLSGDSGDEVFAGYETYMADRLGHVLRWVPNIAMKTAAHLVDRLFPVSFDKVSLDFKLRQFLAGHDSDFRRAHLAWRQTFPVAEQERLLQPDLAASVLAADPFDSLKPHFDRVENCQYLDQLLYVDAKSFLVDDILVKVDRASMAHSLEVRAPFLDYRIMEFSAGLPIDWKLRGLQKKRILKRSQKGRLPDAVINRKKKGFNAPISHWLSQTFGDLIYESATSPASLEWFQKSYIDELWDHHRKGQKDNSFKLFALGSLGLWLNDHKAMENA